VVVDGRRAETVSFVRLTLFQQSMISVVRNDRHLHLADG
jgi:hypothetical protein